MCVRFNCVPTSNLNYSHWNLFGIVFIRSLAMTVVAAATAAATAAECPACCSLVVSSYSFVAFVYLFFFYSVVFRLLLIFFVDMIFLTFLVFFPLFVRWVCVCHRTVLATANQHCLSSGISMWFWVSVSPAVFCRHTDTHLNAFTHTHTRATHSVSRTRMGTFIIHCVRM